MTLSCDIQRALSCVFRERLTWSVDRRCELDGHRHWLVHISNNIQETTIQKSQGLLNLCLLVFFYFYAYMYLFILLIFIQAVFPSLIYNLRI